jgi:hypothetical protein
MNNTPASVMKYILFFSAIYAGFMICVNILVHVFNIDIGSGANIAMLIGAGYGAAIKFVQDTKRPPSKYEKRLLSFGCLVSSFLISLVGVAIIIPLALGSSGLAELKQLLNELSITASLLIPVFIGLLYYAILNTLFGWAANKYAAKAISQNEM